VHYWLVKVLKLVSEKCEVYVMYVSKLMEINGCVAMINQLVF